MKHTIRIAIMLLIGSVGLADQRHQDKDDAAPLLAVLDTQGRIAKSAIFLNSDHSNASATILQKEKAFEPSEVSIKVNDKLAIVNEDDFIHNAYCQSSSFQFNIGAQQPGQHDVVQFTEPGKYLVRCAIHIKMRLVVHVEE